jgi:SAM-dependent methyltransferase
MNAFENQYKIFGMKNDMNDNIDRQQQEKYERLWENEWRDLHKIGPSVRTRNRILLRYFLKFIQSGTVFDSGCGDGNLLILLHKHYKRNLVYHAGDISETATAAIRELDFIQEASIIDVANAASLPKKKFSAVISSEVLEHIEDWENSLQNLVKLVEHHGYLFITVPAQMRYWSIHDDFAKHYHRFEQGEIENVLIDAGFELKESWCWGWPIYWLYYTFFLQNMNPKSVMKDITTPAKRITSSILYASFFIDDLFRTKLGRRLFIVAQKTK